MLIRDDLLCTPHLRQYLLTSSPILGNVNKESTLSMCLLTSGFGKTVF